MSTLIKGGRVITAADDYVGDVYVERERISMIGESIDVERLAEHRDAVALDVDVADVVVGGRDDPSALDQCRHVISPPSEGKLRAGGFGGPELTPRRYLPPAFSTTTAFLNPLP